MTKYEDIIGQEHLIAHLRAAVRTGRVSHAYLIEGTGHGQKLKIAQTFAAALQCETGSGDPCGSCRSCRQAAGRNQPDIIYVTHEKPRTLAVDDIRQQINETVLIRPYSSRYKIYLIDDAHLMTVQAQNALLKTLEEPPAYAVFLLLTENTQVFLPTIRSRCVTLRCKPVADERIREYLMKEHQVPDYQADLCVAFAQGEVGKAVRLAGSASFHERKALAVRQMERLAQTPLFSLADEIAQIEDLKTNAQAYLELLLYWFRDVLVYKAAGPDAGLIFSDAGAGIAKQARQYSWRGLSDCLEAVRRAQTRIRANVNAALTLELMLIEMRDAFSKH